MIRDYISENPDEWSRIINSDAFKECFTVEGTSLKNVPKGYDAEHPQAEFLKFKSWYVEYPISDEILLSSEFVDIAVDKFVKMKSFNDYLNKALADFKMPVRL